MMRQRPDNVRGPLVATAALLALGLAPLPGGWVAALRQCARTPEINRADRDADGGYYEALINGGDGAEGARGGLALRLAGKPTAWINFHDINAARYRRGDYLLFELRPNTRRVVFGQPFTTNRFGQRDRDYPRAKAPGTFRIALLGSSIDMGWGVGTDATYENRLEDWLNAHAARRGSSRRFEVMNFAVAAYSPMQRLESFRRKAAEFEPDLVLYSMTLLDTRLIELQLCKMLQCRVALRDAFLRRAVAEAGVTAADLRRDADGELHDKAAVKAKLRTQLWGIADDTLGELAAECRSRGLPLYGLIVPRAGVADAPAPRAVPVARLKGIAARHAVPVLDLSAAFDAADPTAVEVAAWDDHPNDRGHQLLFLALARALVNDRELYERLFDGAQAHRTRGRREGGIHREDTKDKAEG
jgi:hypothetical protein